MRGNDARTQPRCSSGGAGAAAASARVRELVENAGAKLYFLPPYSPDLNPIELAWSWVKRWLKTARARTESAVNFALRLAMDMVDGNHGVSVDQPLRL